MPTAVWALEWIDVDPARHCFDRARIADIVNRVIQDEGIAKRLVTSKRQRFEDDVDRASSFREGSRPVRRDVLEAVVEYKPLLAALFVPVPNDEMSLLPYFAS